MTAPTALRTEEPTSDMTEVSDAAIWGSKTMMGMTARSCNSKIPTEARPCNVCISPRACIKRKATAVDDIANAMPIMTDSLRLLCMKKAAPPTIKAVPSN